jgi:hypothetical protein
MAAEVQDKTSVGFFSPDTALGQTGDKPKEAMLVSDSGRNLSEMRYTLYSPVMDLGLEGRNVGEVVRFTAPRAGWKLKSVLIVGWSGFNNTSKTFPPDGNFMLEIRDSNTDLLYKFVDTQNYYFASPYGPVAYIIDVPPITLTGDFYITFYDRGNMYIGAEMGNGTGNSYFVVKGRLVPAELRMASTNETVKINWLIRAIGE